MATKKKKDDRSGPSTGGKVTSRIDKPKGTQPLTLGSGGLRTSKISKAQQTGTRKALAAIALTAIPMGAGARVGATAGKAVAKALGKETRTTVAKSANKGGGMSYPKAPTGSRKRIAPNRDVLVKQKYGSASVKAGENKPTARVIKREVTRAKADTYTRAASARRRTESLAQGKRAEEAVSQSKLLPKSGKRIGMAAGTTPAASSTKKKGKK